MLARHPLSSFQGWQHRVCVDITFRQVCSSLFLAEFRDDVRITIPAIVEGMKNSNQHLRNAATELLSRLATQGMY